MNIVFMGTPDFAVSALSKLYDAGHNILAIVSQMDKPVGRGMRCIPTPVKEYAISKNIKVLQPEKIKDNEEFLDTLRALNPDVIVVAAYGKILPKEILDLPKYGAINIHASLLPKYRGSAPIQWSIINGDDITGITIMHMDIGMDTGNMIMKEEVVIEDNDTYGTLYEKLKKAGGILIVKALDRIIDGIANSEKQPDDYSIAPMIEKSLGNINWNNEARDIRNLIRGLNPAPGAFTHYQDKVMKIWSAEICEYEMKEKVLPGTIIRANQKEGIIVATKDKFLNLIEIQMPNSKKMLSTDYLRGNKIEVGTVLLN